MRTLNRRTPGSFKHRNQRAFAQSANVLADPWLIANPRVGRILASIQADIGEGGRCRVRQILRNPRELYRLELARPDMSYERTTILDGGALEELLELLPEETVREYFTFA